MVTNKEDTESLVMNVWPDTGHALNLSRATTFARCADGTIPTIRIGKRLLVPVKALNALLDSAGKPKEN